MLFKGFTTTQIHDAVAACKDKYPTLRFDLTKCWQTQRTKEHRVTGVLRVANGKAAGARVAAASGRRTPSCSWDVHYDFMAALYQHNPEGVIQTMLATYNGAADFHLQCNKAYNATVGATYNPQKFGELPCVPAI